MKQYRNNKCKFQAVYTISSIARIFMEQINQQQTILDCMHKALAYDIFSLIYL